MPPLPKTCPKMVLSDKGGSLCVKDVFAKKFLVSGEIPRIARACTHKLPCQRPFFRENRRPSQKSKLLNDAGMIYIPNVLSRIFKKRLV